MPSLSTSTGLTITNPLVLYRALIATKQIEPDPAQHRLALHLQKLYYRLKDYQPELDSSHRLGQLNQLVERSPVSSTSVEHEKSNRSNTQNKGIFPSLRGDQGTQATALARRLTDHELAIQLQSPQGLLLYGEVGTGKSLLVDLLADSLPNRKKKRWHFNTFMLETFARLEQLRKVQLQSSTRNASNGTVTEEHSLLRVARDLISTSSIIFLDEFQLPDRAASKILSNLLTSFFHLGGVLIATSNRMPEELANASGIEFSAPPASRLGLLGNRWGLLGSHKQAGRSENMFSQKGDFAAFLDVLRARCEIWDMEGSTDWRRRDAERASEEGTSPSQTLHNFGGLEPMAVGNVGLGYEQSLHVNHQDETNAPKKSFTSEGKCPNHYFVRPARSRNTDDLEDSVSAWTNQESQSLSGTNEQSSNGEMAWKSTSLRVYGRTLLVPRHLSGVTKWTFDELCSTNLGPADYISLASTFHTFILTNVPILTLLQKNEARRFITLLDALYEARCKLLISAEAGPDDLFFPDSRPLPTSTNRTSPPSPSSTGDAVYSETFSEIYQDTTSPFRPNISSYTPSASSPSYSSDRSILADEDSDFGPLSGTSRRHSGPSDGAPGAGNEIGRQVDFARTGAFTGEDEKFAYKRARSRLWEMCGSRWWAREGDWWRPLGRDARRWQGDAVSAADSVAASTSHLSEMGEASNEGDKQRNEGNLFRQVASPFRTSTDAPPKFSWVHSWGMMKWGKKAGAWGKGIEGLEERKNDAKSEGKKT